MLSRGKGRSWDDLVDGKSGRRTREFVEDPSP